MTVDRVAQGYGYEVPIRMFAVRVLTVLTVNRIIRPLDWVECPGCPRYPIDPVTSATTRTVWVRGPYPTSCLENCIKKTMHQAFWDILRSSLESDPPDFAPALRLLAEVKQSLNGLVLPNQKTLQKLIDNSLDLDVARVQLEETGQVCLEAYAEQAFALLEKMHMDLANFTIAQMRPYIRQQAATYERTKFTAFLEAQQAVGVDGLVHTRNWIREAYEQLAPSSDEHSTEFTTGTIASAPSAPLSSTLPQSASCGADDLIGASDPSLIPPTPNNILREAYLLLLTRTTANNWPETVIMDQQRITDIGAHLSLIVKLSSLVLVVCNYVAFNATRIFPSTSSVRLDSTIMPELKQSLCRSGLLALTTDQKEVPDSETDTADQIVLTVEHWCNRVLNNRSTTQFTASSPTDPHVAPFLLPTAVVEPLKKQIGDVLNAIHPIYALMCEFKFVDLDSNSIDSAPLFLFNTKQ
ncbi:unnamed protein product [Echinostoma caproni]|uniref:Exocyst complex component Sec8 n=1 Tax=Echinostoma caproni TaxID=27848 RepID=A0A183AJ50_9TREM|nr:unnamed protein product [Echinostoma caproni]